MTDERLDLAVRIADERWEPLGLEAITERAALAVFDVLELPGPHEVSLLATNDAEIAGLNGAFRGKDAATNVLSWPAEELAATTPGGAPARPSVEELGDVALGYETCVKEAKAAGLRDCDHVTHLIVHAIFHLLGYDHQTDADAALMEGLEIRTLAKLGINNPY